MGIKGHRREDLPATDIQTGRLVRPSHKVRFGVNTTDPQYDDPAAPERQTRSRKSQPASFESNEVGTGRG